MKTKKLLTPAELRPYQWRAFWWGVRKKCAALFLDMGLGKTIIVLSILKYFFHKKILTKPVLLIAPIRVIYTVWMQEAARWRHTRSLTFSIVHGTEKQRLAALDVPADIYLINPHNIRWLLRLLRSKKARNNWPFGGLVIDESSAFKNAGAKRFRTLRHYVHLFSVRLILSGTPTPNSLLELWSQMFIVD
jgi:SNF2 family DNA or RNA helicase